MNQTIHATENHAGKSDQSNIERSLAYFFADHVTRLRFEDLSLEALTWARMGILDTVGVTLAGSQEPCAVLISKALGLMASAPGVAQPNPSARASAHPDVGADVRADVRSNPSAVASVWGHHWAGSPLDAAYINGTAAHALDFDDCNNTMGGHPSAPILPALFALAKVHPVSAKDLMVAYIAGFEVETKLAMTVNFHHYTKGWHPTATLGVFGAAAACSKLLRLDVEQTAVALALAASSAAGIKANFGTMTKPMHVGRCAREGLMAAMLAKEGYSANALSVFEHDQGFFEVFNGAGFYAPEKARTHWARPWDIVEPGIAIKQYPCCGSTHPAVDCAIELFQEHRFAPQDIERIQIWIHARRLTHTNRPHPQSELDAKFSFQYVVVRALLEGRVGIGHFEPKDFQSNEVLALLPLVQARAYDDTMFEASNHFAARVSVTLKGDKVLTKEVMQPHGRTSKNPLRTEQLKAKFDLCAQKVLTPKGVDLAYQWIESMLMQSDAGSLEEIFVANLK